MAAKLGGVVRLGLGVAIMSILAACAVQGPRQVDQRNSELTQGNVQMTLRVGETDKAEVLETFGAPNITTRDASGTEVWSYQRHARVTQSESRSNHWTVLFAGGGSRADGFSETMRTMTLIIRFDENDIVSDFRSRTSDF